MDVCRFITTTTTAVASGENRSVNQSINQDHHSLIERVVITIDRLIEASRRVASRRDRPTSPTSLASSVDARAIDAAPALTDRTSVVVSADNGQKKTNVAPRDGGWGTGGVDVNPRVYVVRVSIKIDR